MAIRRPDVQCVCVDPWTEEWEDAGETLPVGPDRELRDKHGGMFEAFRACLQEHAPGVFERIDIRRGPSAEVLKTLGDASAAAVFLDGDHSYEGLKSDIEHGLRIVKPGGVLAGHDFTQVSWGGAVQRAVRDMLLFRPCGKGYELQSWPHEREGWEHGYSSVWVAKAWSGQAFERGAEDHRVSDVVSAGEPFALDAAEDPARDPVEP